jgi:hypothetical protein
MDDDWIIVIKAYNTFHRVFHPVKAASGLYFWKFVGMEQCACKMSEITDEAVLQRIKQLAGPYGAAMAKAMHVAGRPIDQKAAIYDPDNKR